MYTPDGITRIRSPHENDVLSGRGGAINAHKGNQRFREWVKERKSKYNLARSKTEKTAVALEVIALVTSQKPPGRFLQRDGANGFGSSNWWIVSSDDKAVAKTCQALREGAPSIRAAHSDEESSRKEKRKRPALIRSVESNKRRIHERITPSSSPKFAPMQNQCVSPIPPLALSAPQPHRMTATFDHTQEHKDGSNLILSTYSPPVEGAIVTPSHSPYFDGPHVVLPDYDTPILERLPSPAPLSEIPNLDIDNANHFPPAPKRFSSLKRINSLALSDFESNVEHLNNLDFVNPFEDDSDILNASW